MAFIVEEQKKHNSDLFSRLANVKHQINLFLKKISQSLLYLHKFINAGLLVSIAYSNSTYNTFWIAFEKQKKFKNLAQIKNI